IFIVDFCSSCLPGCVLGWLQTPRWSSHHRGKEERSMTHNVFILGLDEPGLAELTALPDADQYTFHQLLTIEELQSGTILLPDLLAQAQRELDSFDGTIDAIAGYWDFPVTVMVPI